MTQLREVTTGPVGVFRPRVASAYVGAFFAGGLALSAAYVATGRGVACPFRLLTGWDCPLCGGTRMGGALLRGDLVAAIAFNPVAFVAVVVIGLLGVCWVIEAAGGPAIRPPRRARAWLARVGSTRWLLVGLALAVAWTVLRNLL